MMFGKRDFRTNLRCLKCQGPLHGTRGCREVHLRCVSCGAMYDLREFGTTLDDLVEEYLANIPCDRV